MACLIGRTSLTAAPLTPDSFYPALTSFPSGSTRNQPAQYAHLQAALDGRLHNHDELIAALDVTADSALSDEYLVAQAYACWGSDCLNRLHGEFSLAVCDQNARSVFLARDHVGSRPLFWSLQGDEVLFSSLLRGITAFTDIDWAISEHGVAHYLAYPHYSSSDTFWRDIEAVQPGHWVCIKKDSVTRQRWWSPQGHVGNTAISKADALDGVRHFTEQAVRNRILPGDRLGSHISGGIDSTVVTTLAVNGLREHGMDLAGAYTWSPSLGDDYAEMVDDERIVIANHCRSLGIEPTFGSADASQFEELIARPMELEGTADLADELSVIRCAKADGVTAMLSGWGGDELFSNHATGYFASLLRTGRLRKAAGFIRAGGGHRQPWKTLQYLWQTGVVPNLPNAIYSKFNPFVDLRMSEGFLSPDLKALLEPADRPPPIRLVADADAYLHRLIHNGHIGERMATWAAWSSDAGFEYRYPLTDRRLWEFMLSLPAALRFGQGKPRFLAHKAFANILPKGLSKADVANEKRRHKARLQWWRMLADDARDGRFDSPCDWLDMNRLRRAITDPIPEDGTRQTLTFVHIFMAMRVWAMYQRQKIHVT